MLIILSIWSLSIPLMDVCVKLLTFATCLGVSSWFMVPLTLLHDNRLDLVLTDVPNIVDISIGSLLGTSDRCLVRCELLGEQNILEHKVRHLVNLNNETTQAVYMVQSEALIWITILRSPNPVETLTVNGPVRAINCMFVPMQ